MASQQELTDALTNVAVLSNHTHLVDQPSIEAAPVSLDCDASFDTNFGDREAFVRGVSKYVEEAKSLGDLNSTLEKGYDFAAVLYTWRTCSRAIPQVQSNHQANRKELYEMTLQVLGPEADKIKSLYHFVNDATKQFVENVRKLSHPEVLKGFISQTTKLTLGRMLDMFALLDRMKNVKSSLSNDFSFWKRAHSFLNQEQKSKDPQDIMEVQHIGLWLATQRSIEQNLEQELLKIDNYQDALAEIVNECASLLENESYVLSSEKHMLLKTAAFGLYLMDLGEPKKSIYKNKAVDIKRFDKIFKQMPVVPLFGDMHIALMEFVKRGKNYADNVSQWVSGSEKDEARVNEKEFNIVHKLEGFKKDRDQLLCALRLANGTTVEGRPVNQCGEKTSDLALRGLKMLANWTTTVNELYAWKLAHPMDRFRNRECTDDKLDYEKACRYNYDAEEKTALIETIAMIKDVSRHLWQMHIVLGDAIRRDMHNEIQTFIQITLREPIRYTNKKKKAKAKTVLLGLRSTCADWLEATEPTDDPSLKGLKDPKYVVRPIPSRATGPGSTQLFMMRTMLESLCADNHKKSLAGDLESATVKTLLEFYHRTYFFDKLLNYNQSLQQAADLSQLWYREYFLELTRGTMIQFPIEMSMPFMLVDHILTSRDPSMIEYVLYPLDLYNDAASYALLRFKKQYLYDEVEAEVDLAFDQFIMRLATEIFTHYKTRASTIMLSSKFKTECKANNHVLEEMSEHRYSTVLAQTSFQLLGRSVDISRLLIQHMNTMLRKSIDLAIRRFEANDLAKIHEFADLIENNRQTHALLSETLTLDPFDEMYAEMNSSVKQPILNRITLTVFAELCTDLIPNFAFNGGSHRFVRPKQAPVFGEGEPRREKQPMASSMYWFGNKNMDKTFAAIHSRYSGFVGRPHFDMIARLLGYGSIAFCIDEMIRVVDHAVKNVVAPFVKILLEGMPGKSKLPVLDYGSDGAIGFYQLSLKDIMSYPDLQTDMFHAFREIGNGIIIFMMLEESLTKEEVLDLAQAMPFQGIVPTQVKEGEDVQKKLAEAAAGVQFMKFNLHLKALKDPLRKQLGGQAELLTQKRLCKGFSIFTAVLRRVKQCLEEAEVDGVRVFQAPPPSNGIMDVDECNQFHRLWSAIVYTSCITGTMSKYDYHQHYFGDGLAWAGCTIIALTKQQRRFEVFDFCGHILRAWNIDHKESDHMGINVGRFVEIASQKQVLSSQIFNMLDKFLNFPEFKDEPEYIPPPNPDADAETAV